MENLEPVNGISRYPASVYLRDGTVTKCLGIL